MPDQKKHNTHYLCSICNTYTTKQNTEDEVYEPNGAIMTSEQGTKQ